MNRNQVKFHFTNSHYSATHSHTLYMKNRTKNTHYNLSVRMKWQWVCCMCCCARSIQMLGNISRAYAFYICSFVLDPANCEMTQPKNQIASARTARDEQNITCQCHKLCTLAFARTEMINIPFIATKSIVCSLSGRCSHNMSLSERWINHGAPVDFMGAFAIHKKSRGLDFVIELGAWASLNCSPHEIFNYAQPVGIVRSCSFAPIACGGCCENAK